MLCIENKTSFTQYIAKVQQFPILSQEEEIWLARSWYEGQDVSSAHKLITSHLNLVVKIAFKLKNYGLSMMDLVMEGNIGLMQAVKKYNPDLGYRFSTYAVWWIKAAMKDFILRSWSFVKVGTTQAQRKLFFSLRKIKRRLLRCSGREILNDEEIKIISHELAVSEKDVIQMNSRLAHQDLSLDNDCNGSIQDVVVSNLKSQELVCQSNEENILKEVILKDALASLNERAKDIFISRYMFESPETLDTLSKRHSVSRERIRQIAEQAMQKVKQYVQSESLRLKLHCIQ